MTATAQGTRMRCDKTGCNEIATVDKDVWSFCAAHAGTPAQPAPTRPPVATTPRPAPSAAMPQVVGGGTIGLLLEQASAHSSKRVRNLADRIETQLEQLRTVIADLAEHEKAKQDAIRAKAAAKAEVERLAKQLAEARAKLRPASPKTPVKEGDARITPQECTKGCGKTCGGTQGRLAHERKCTGKPT